MCVGVCAWDRMPLLERPESAFGIVIGMGLEPKWPNSQTSQMIKLCCEYLYVRCIWLFVLIITRTCFRVNPHCIVAWMSRNSLLETYNIWKLSVWNGTRTNNHLVCKQTLLDHLAKLAKWLSYVVSTYIQCIRLHVLVMSRTFCRVNPHYIRLF